MAIKFEKFDPEKRTFETRLIFIKEIFLNKHSKSEIMAQCIQHKLGRSFEEYVNTLSKSAWKLKNKDPMKVLRKVDSQEI